MLLLSTYVTSGMKEYQAEATFLHYVYFHGGARHAGYNPIAAGGKSGILSFPDIDQLHDKQSSSRGAALWSRGGPQ